ncbi:hypothetical protein MTO96_034507, partial [Rhipicephalus appendiculatus]
CRGPFYWLIHQFLGSLPVSDATLGVESNCEGLSISQTIHSMETGEDLGEPLGNEADMQLLTDIQRASKSRR